MEFTYILNGAVVRFGVDFSDHEQVLSLCERVKGAINIGLERLVKDSDRTVQDVYQTLGLGKLYRLGVTELISIRSLARKISLEDAESIRGEDAVLFSIVACAREPFPCAPECIDNSGLGIERDGSLATGIRPIDNLELLGVVKERLSGVRHTPIVKS
jgi:hypothetical protein